MSGENVREIAEGLQFQGVDESIAYTLTTTQWSHGAVVSSPSAKVFSVVGTTITDVTTTVMPTGSASVLGEVITLPALKLLTADTMYRIEVQFTTSGNVFEAYAYIKARR